jgi:beta-ribofuranosylaminobenzene 5'-phosphate synthase
MTRVRAPSRLHFGLLNPSAGGAWASIDGGPALPARRFGGVGLMVEEPGVEVSVHPAARWGADGPLAERALAFARRVAEALPELPPRWVTVGRAAPEHAGLGTGTQLGLAVARALTADAGLDLPAAELARLSGRGRRSAVGVHGFERGGLIVEAGKAGDEPLAPLVVRAEFPEPWRVVVAVPAGAPGVHGADEERVFEGLDAPPPADALCRLVLLGMLPALAARDLSAFGEALGDFNARAGEVFARAQGGRYAGPAAELIAFLRGLGARGVGQSSWGPAVFGVAEADRADDWARQLRDRFPGATVWVTAASTAGAEAGAG